MSARIPLAFTAASAERRARYTEVTSDILAMIAGETDEIAILSTVVCELHHAFEWYDWTGFYRCVAERELSVGPYQGGHGCLRIPFDRGICGAAARERRTQLVPDVQVRPDHIACASSTQSEIVVPVITPDGRLIAVLDVDSDAPAAFDAVDQQALEALCAEVGRRMLGVC